jgi:hypothetical protein
MRMTEYRFFRVDTEDQIQGAPKFMTCADDRSARSEARQLMDGYAIEIWDCERRVAYIPPEEPYLRQRATISA